MKTIIAAVCVVLLAGCASYAGRGLVPGQSSSAEVEAVMGRAAAKRPGPDGETVLWFPRMPYGDGTYAARVSADGRLIAIEQRLTEENIASIERGRTAADKRVHDGETWLYFPRQPYGQATYVARIDRDGRLIVIEQRITDDNLARIVPGKTRLDEVRELFGPPYTDTNFQRMQREILEYRMRSVSSPVPYAVYVQASPDGIVREVYKMSDPDYRLGDCCNP